MSIAKDFVNSIKDATKEKTSSYDTQATVTRIEGKTAWVHIPGGVTETPVQLTIGSRVGDKVQVRVSGGRAWLVGNASAPPTDDSTAITINKQTNRYVKSVEAKVDSVSKIAGDTDQYFWHTESGTDTGAHITEIPRERFLADPDNGGGNLLARSNGIAVRDGLTELATFGASGVEIGKTGEPRIKQDATGLTFIDDNGVQQSVIEGSEWEDKLSQNKLDLSNLSFTTNAGFGFKRENGLISLYGDDGIYADPNIFIFLNTTSASGTDHDLYAAITALGWATDCLIDI